MISALEKFETAIKFESNDKQEFITDISKGQPSALIKREANKILKKRKLIEIDEDLSEYNHSDGLTSRIDVFKGECSCLVFFDKGICPHLVASRLINAIIVPKLTLRSRRRQNLTTSKKRSLSAVI